MHAPGSLRGDKGAGRGTLAKVLRAGPPVCSDGSCCPRAVELDTRAHTGGPQQASGEVPRQHSELWVSNGPGTRKPGQEVVPPSAEHT